MKICATVCEYNPFHNGHLKHLEYIKKEIKPDYIVVFLSGNFTQRGETAIVDKFTRAEWAVKAGADAVIELPVVFATSTAEIFCSGAVKLINALPYNKTICFGTESNDKQALIDLCKILLNESNEMKAFIKSELDNGQPLIKARNSAIKKFYPNIDSSYIEAPNNILGIEYVKAILKNGYDINVETLVRKGGGYNSDEIVKNLSSALAIRTAIKNGKNRKIKSLVPRFVYNQLPAKLPNYDKEIIYALLTASPQEIANTLECSEGLENRIKSLSREYTNVDALLNALKTKRYTDSRLKRILLATALNVSDNLVKQCLNDNLYFKVLAINKNKTEILSVLSNSAYPLVTRKSDAALLSDTAKLCFEKDVFANDFYSLITGTKTNEFEMKLI